MSLRYRGSLISSTAPTIAPGSAQSIWALQEQYQAQASSLWPPSGVGFDEYFENVTLLLPGNGTNGAQNNTFLDSSNNNFTITRNGNSTQGTFSPFSKTAGRWGLRTSDRSYLTIPASGDFDLISTDYTVEFFFYLNAFNTMSGSGNNLFGNAYATANNGWSLEFGGSGTTVTSITFSAWNGGSRTNNSFTVSFNLGSWHHIAFVRSGSGAGNLKLYINGVQAGSAQNAPTYSTAGSTFVLGSGAYTQNPTYSGNADYYISNVRITKSAVYTSNFTTPTSELSAFGATTLLICQSNRLINNGTNTGAISSATFSALASVQPFSPFPTLTTYASGTNGGSGYFDGTGDYLTVPDSTALNLETGDFTIELWFYVTMSSVNSPLICRFDGDASSRNELQFAIAYNSSGNLVLAAYQSTTNNDITFTGVSINQWHHCALVRSGNSFYGYLNGVRNATTPTISGSLNNGGFPTWIGGYREGGTFQYLNGFISNVRILKGTALYTGSTYTVPTAPLTAITNTALLTNYTNGGIIDTSMFNNLETVGNAQISTTENKFGGSSIYFDGSGDYLVVRYNKWFGLLDDQSDFTLEGWFYRTVVGTGQFLLSTMEFTGTYTGWSLVFNNTNTAGFFCYDSGNTPQSLTSTATVGLNTWAHVAVSRSGGTTRLFVNGVIEATRATAFADTVTQSPLVMGLRPEFGDNVYTGYMQYIRITKGVGRYTSNFTVSSVPFNGFGN